MDPFILDALRKMVISEFGEVAGAVVDADAERRRKASIIDSLVTPMALTRCYMMATRDFLGVKTDENVLELVGEYWACDLLADDSWERKPPIDLIQDGLAEINRIHTLLNQKYTGQAHFPLFTLALKTDNKYMAGETTDSSMGVPGKNTCSGKPVGMGQATQEDFLKYTVTVSTGMYEHRMPTCVGIIKGVLRTLTPGAEAMSAGSNIVIKLKRRCTEPRTFASQFSISGADINILFPYHIAFDYRMRVVQTGTKMSHMCHIPLDSLVYEQFHFPLISPEKKLSETIEILNKQSGRLLSLKRRCHVMDNQMLFYGQLHHFKSYGLFVFLCTPNAETLYAHHSSLLDLPVFNRVCGIPFNSLDLAEVDIDESQRHHSNDSAGDSGCHGNPDTASRKASAKAGSKAGSEGGLLPPTTATGKSSSTQTDTKAHAPPGDTLTQQHRPTAEPRDTMGNTPMRQPTSPRRQPIGVEANGTLSPGFLPIPSKRTLQGIKKNGLSGYNSSTSLNSRSREDSRSNSSGDEGEGSDSASSKIKVYRKATNSDATVDPDQLDLSTPVQKFYSALQLLRLNLPPDYRKQIDDITKQLSRSYDVYLPSSPSTNVKDKEIRSYMESFFPTQAGLKFDQQARAGLNRTLSLVGRAGSPKPNYKSGKEFKKRQLGRVGSTGKSTSFGEIPEIPEAEGRYSAEDGSLSPVLQLSVPVLDKKEQQRSGKLNRGKDLAKTPDFVDRCISQINEPLYMGFLNKESSVNMRSWRRRYFVLEQNYLSYFRDNDSDATPLAVIDLEEYDTVKRVTRKSGTCIELSCSAPEEAMDEHGEWVEVQRKYYMYADTEEENQDWLDTLADTLAENKMRKMQWSSFDASPTSTALKYEEIKDYKPDRSRSIVVTEDIRIDIPRRLSQPQFGWLRHLGDLNFDVFEVANHTNDRPLQFVGKAILQNTGLSDKFSIPEDKLDRFLRYIGKGYRKSNPYHNEYHATDVTQTVYHFLYTLGLAQYFGDREALAAIVAAMIHDFQHPGVNNAYLVNSRSAEALLYNDHSVLENMHLAKAFQILSRDDCNIFCNLSAKDYQHVRTLIIQMVLNTDMSYHFELMGKFKSAVVVLREEESEEVPNKTIMLILAMAVHCADVSNPCKNKHIYGQWAQRVMEEFWNQGDLETVNQMAISPMCDRHTVSIEKCQSSFIQFIVEPLYETFSILMPELYEECIPNLHDNKEYWQNRLAILEGTKEQELELEQEQEQKKELNLDIEGDD